MPEAKLAKEAEISYAMIGLPTDYDAWRPHDGDAPPESLLKEIIGNLDRATDSGVRLIQQALELIGSMEEPWVGPDALKLALWTDRTKISPAVRERLAPILGTYLND
jgi:5'-methylthioadenosine phosphorylase